MATTNILRETENDSIVFISGATGPETLTPILHPGGATGPVGATGFFGATGIGITSIEKIDWSITGSNIISLYFNGNPGKLIGHFDGSGRIDYWRDYQSKITNTANSTDSVILLTSTTSDPYTIIMKIEKTEGFFKVGQYT
jgi:hypothetical protein